MNQRLLGLAFGAVLTSGTGAALSEPVGPIIAAVSESQLAGEVMVVNTETRLMTLKDADGNFHVLHVPPRVSRIDEIKIGDEVTITEVSSALIALTPADADTPIGMDTVTALERESGSTPGGTLTETLTVSGRVVAVDQGDGTVTIEGPGQTQTFDVSDRSLLDGVEEGDSVIAQFRNVIVGEVVRGSQREPGPPGRSH